MTERSKQNYEKYYDIIELIGIGSYGPVYKGKDKKTKELRAIKVMDFKKIKNILSYQYEPNDINKQLECIVNKKIFVQIIIIQ